MLRFSKSFSIRNSFAFQYFKLCPDEYRGHDIISYQSSFINLFPKLFDYVTVKSSVFAYKF